MRPTTIGKIAIALIVAGAAIMFVGAGYELLFPSHGESLFFGPTFRIMILGLIVAVAGYMVFMLALVCDILIED